MIPSVVYAVDRRTRRTGVWIVAAIACLVAGEVPLAAVHAQTTCTVTAGSCSFTATLANIPVLSQVTTSSTSFSMAPGGALTAADFARGFFEPSSPLSVVVETNAGTGSTPSATTLKWNVTSSAWSTSCPIALSDLTFATTSVGTRSAVPTVSTNLLSSITRSSPLASRTATLYFRVALGWGDVPTVSACTLPIRFTLSAP